MTPYWERPLCAVHRVPHRWCKWRGTHVHTLPLPMAAVAALACRSYRRGEREQPPSGCVAFGR